MPFGDGTEPIGKGQRKGMGKRYKRPVKNCVCPKCGAGMVSG